MKFIKLTLKDGRDVFVNYEKISDIIRQNVEGSFVTLTGENCLTVKQSPEQIFILIEIADKKSEVYVEPRPIQECKIESDEE